MLANTLSSKPTGENYETPPATRSTLTLSPSQTIDILMSNAWPSLITAHSNCPLPSKELSTLLAPPLDDIVRRTQPRYHFAMGGGTAPIFWEREPFIWEDDDRRVTRFVSLGAFGSILPIDKKQRVRIGLYELYSIHLVFLQWFYAFSISSRLATNTILPSNVSINPFLEPVARGSKRSFETSEGNSFIFGDVQHPVKRTRGKFKMKKGETNH